MEFTDVETEPDLDERAFAMVAPPGYEQRRCGTWTPLRFVSFPGWRDCPFRYAAASDPPLAQLRIEQRLGIIVQACTTDLERVRSLCAWTHERWQHKGDGRPRASDALSILAEARTGGRFRCVEYATVLRAGLQSLGIPARMVNLLPRDIETSYGGAGHMVVEAFLRDQRAWVFADPQFGVVTTMAGKPASAVDLQLAMATGQPVDFGARLGDSLEEYRRFVGARLCYFRVWIDQSADSVDREGVQWMLVPDGAPEPRVFERTLRIESGG